MVLIRAMANRRANNNVEATRNIETPTTRARDSRDSHSGRNIRTSSRDSTAIFSNEAEGSINVHGNAFSTTTGSHGAQQQYITREDQSSSIGSTSSNTQAAQAAHVVETKCKRNAEDLDSQPQVSGSSTESSQDPCEDVSSPPPTKSKTRKRRSRGWSRKKASRSSPSEHSEGRAIPSSKKRRIGEADAKDHELRSRKRQRVTEPVGGPSSIIPPISEGPPVARNIRSLRSRNVIIPAANGGTTRGQDTNRTIQTTVPGLVVERPRLDDTQPAEPESTPVKIEEEDETNFLFNAPGPSNYFPKAPVNAPISESVFQYDSNPGTPGLMAEDNENRRGESNSPDSTPVTTPHGQSIERSPTIVTLGTIDEDQSYWAAEEGDEEEDENDASESVVVVNRERSMAPSPPSLSPSHHAVRPATPQRVEEPHRVLHWVLWPIFHI